MMQQGNGAATGWMNSPSIQGHRKTHIPRFHVRIRIESPDQKITDGDVIEDSNCLNKTLRGRQSGRIGASKRHPSHPPEINHIAVDEENSSVSSLSPSPIPRLRHSKLQRAAAWIIHPIAPPSIFTCRWIEERMEGVDVRPSPGGLTDNPSVTAVVGEDRTALSGLMYPEMGGMSDRCVQGKTCRLEAPGGDRRGMGQSGDDDDDGKTETFFSPNPQHSSAGQGGSRYGSALRGRTRVPSDCSSSQLRCAHHGRASRT